MNLKQNNKDALVLFYNYGQCLILSSHLWINQIFLPFILHHFHFCGSWLAIQ